MPPQLPFCIIQPLRIPDIWVGEPTALLVAGHRGWRLGPPKKHVDGWEGKSRGCWCEVGFSVDLESVMGVGSRALVTGFGSGGENTHSHTHTHRHTDTHTHFSPPTPGTLWVKSYSGVRYFCVWTSLLSLIGSQPSYLTFLNLIDLIWKSSRWRSNEREIHHVRAVNTVLSPRPLCMDLRWHCRGGNRVQGKYKAGRWVREQQRNTEEVIWKQNCYHARVM